MEIRLLQEFVSLVETGSFQETAERMNISQSALTKHIHKLEEDLGVSLFDRSTRSVGLNDFSRTYYPYAQKITALYEESNAAITAMLNKGRNELRVAFTPALVQYGLMDMLYDFTKQYPKYQLEITESPRVVEMLCGHMCDFAFATENSAINGNMNQLVYRVDRLVAVLPASHPLADLETVMIGQLQGERFILRHNSSGGMQLETRKFLELCQQWQIKPDIVANASAIPTILKMIGQGQGVSVLHRGQLPEELENVVVKEIVPAVQSCVYALYQNKRRLSAAANAFLHFLITRIGEGE